jgi:hypothetical protein
LKIELLAGESLGTRSMAAYIETSDARILIDPGVALAPRRFGLPPHRIELDRQREQWETVVKYGKGADIIVITHYHYDHHNPKRDLKGLFSGKTVLCKDPLENINFSQSRRGMYFIDRIKEFVGRIEYSDERWFQFGDTRIVFSKPTPHGVDTRLGYVLEVYISDGDDSFLFSSDVEGLPLDEQLEFIEMTNPETVYIDGPLTYMLGSKYPESSLNSALSNIKRLTRLNNLRKLIIDHHLTRDAEWVSWITDIRIAAESRGIWVGTAAEFMGKRPSLLEAYRRELYTQR